MDGPRTLRMGKHRETLSASNAIAALQDVQETLMQQNAEKTIMRATIREQQKRIEELEQALKEMSHEQRAGDADQDRSHDVWPTISGK